MVPAIWQVLTVFVILSVCVLVVGLVFAAHLLVRVPGRNALPVSLLLLFFLVNLGVSLDDAFPALFGGIRFVPADPLGLLLTFVPPLVLFTLLLFLPGFMQDANKQMPLAWLTWPQTFRSIGGLFLVYYAYHQLPAGFALPAGIGDLLVGCTAPLMTAYVLRNPEQTRLPIAWNLFGVLDFAVAVGTGFALGAPSQYPLSLIPGFLVPFALLLHLYSFRKLARQRKAAASPSRSAPAQSLPAH